MAAQPSMSIADYRAHLAAKARSGRVEHEYHEQVLFFVWLDVLADENPLLVDDLREIWASANGGHRSGRTAGRLRAAGARKGVPDICVMIPRQGKHGLFIELKALGGRASSEQKARLVRLNERGYLALLAVGWIKAANIVCEYLGVAWRPGWETQVPLLYEARKGADWVNGILG